MKLIHILCLILAAAVTSPLALLLTSCGAHGGGASESTDVNGAAESTPPPDPVESGGGEDVEENGGENGGEDTETNGAFLHPGLLNTEADLERIAKEVQAKNQPYYDGFLALKSNEVTSISTPHAVEVVKRGGEGDNIALLYRDAARAYQCALMWKIGGSVYSHFADCARDILNAWSSTLKTVGGNADRYLASGLYGYQLACAAELMRDYPGFDVEAMQDMLINVFYKPLCERFLVSNEYGSDHNDACITNYWANWDLCNMAATIAIGIFCDRRDIYELGIEYFRYGRGNGSIYNAIPHLFDGLAQWQESGRDQGHANLGIGLMAVCCEMAYNQGDDLYGWADNRFMYAAEYVARYNNGDDVPFELFEWATGQRGDWKTQTAISDATRGQMRPIWAMIYNHYHCRMGYSLPNIEKRMALGGVEGGPGGHPSSFDQPGFGTLLYTRPEGSGSTAKPLGGNVEDGVYTLAALHSGKFLTSPENGGGVTQESAGAAGQRWRITHIGSGQYTIMDEDSGLYLQVENGSHEPRARLVTGPYTGDAWQKFVFLPAEDGAFRITAVHASKALDVHHASNDDGVDIIQFRYAEGRHQMWTLTKCADD